MGQQNSLDVLSIKIREEITLKVVQRLTALTFPPQAQTLSPPQFHWARLQPQSVWQAGLPPWQAQKTEHQRDYSRLKIKWNLPCQVLDLLRSMTPFIFLQISPFQNENVYPKPVPPLYFETCLVSQIHSQRRIFASG